MIAGEIKRFLRDDGLIKVSRALKELAYKAYQENERIKNVQQRVYYEYSDETDRILC